MTTLTGPAPTIERDRYGRAMVMPLRGTKPVPYTRATTIAGAVDDTNGLMRWKQVKTAFGLVARPDLAMALAATSPDDKTAVHAIVEQAADAAGATAAATVGTAVHAFTERLDRGLDLGVVPAMYAPDLTAYQQTADQVGWRVLGVEVFTVLHAHKIAGTADRVLELDGVRYIADLKTSQTVDYPHKFAAQLAIYAHSLPYDIESQTTVPWDGPSPSTDRGLIVHLPSGQGRCELHWIDLRAGWDAVHLALAVREWRARRDLLTPYTRPDPILAAIDTATTVEVLTDLWMTHQDVWTDLHTAAAVARKTALTAPAA